MIQKMSLTSSYSHSDWWVYNCQLYMGPLASSKHNSFIPSCGSILQGIEGDSLALHFHPFVIFCNPRWWCLIIDTCNFILDSTSSWSLVELRIQQLAQSFLWYFLVFFWRHLIPVYSCNSLNTFVGCKLKKNYNRIPGEIWKNVIPLYIIYWLLKV